MAEKDPSDAIDQLCAGVGLPRQRPLSEKARRETFAAIGPDVIPPSVTDYWPDSQKPVADIVSTLRPLQREYDKDWS